MSEPARSEEADRYKRTATAALTLLDWCIDYFASNRQGKIAKRLARSRDHVHARLRDATED